MILTIEINGIHSLAIAVRQTGKELLLQQRQLVAGVEYELIQKMIDSSNFPPSILCYF